MDRINPSWEDIESMKNPLTAGELHLVKFLDKILPEPWELYVQPFLNGDRPDVVILNPFVGMVFFEVKDWNPELYSSKNKTILDKKSGKPHTIKQYYVTDGKGSYPIPNPLSQVCRYRDNLINLYLPYFGDLIDKNPKELVAFKVGLYFHKMKTDQARNLIQTDLKHHAVFGNDYLAKKYLADVVHDWNKLSTFSFFPKWVDEIRDWLMPPFHSLEQGKKLTLTPEQKRHAEPAFGKHQRLRGVVGSGKTLVIAQRAASLAEQGKKVLIVTFNITLWHYIRDHVSRARRNFSWERIEFTHFHGFCRNFLNENNIMWPQNENLSDDERLTVTVPEKVLETIQLGNNIQERKYDAILIDEGQDFEQLWYDMLCGFLTENDEVLFVADERQNVYNRNLSWIDLMSGTKFRGRWRELKESYRLPIPIIEKCNQFVNTFMDGEGTAPIPSEYNLRLPGIDPLLLWKNLSDNDDLMKSTWDSFDLLTKGKKINPVDIVILVPLHAEGWDLVKFFKNRGIETNHVFEDDQKSHHHKKSFWMLDPRLKMCTIHSFKGWELLSVILITPDDDSFSGGSLDKLIYTAITRSRENLIILNRNSRYVEYGKTWVNTG